ncbi:uncharacterized protein LOC128733898 [Sabethes cyaneus]|uniref:uncharacterized protein LOC128733898 n=1 Tax=Sabethes cyaneus TaxID=53552 RepID=UPI00237DD795|nr:uncharacterized protein LOC128733898 [Sabethes cyaneus]
MPSVGVFSTIRLLLAGSLLCLWRSGLADGVTLFPANALSIMQGAGFLAYLIPDQLADAGQWAHCSVVINGNRYSLDDDQIHVVGVESKVQRFSASVCGIRVENVQKDLQQTWTISASDAGGSNQVQQNLLLTVIAYKTISTQNITISDTIKTVTISCPDDSSRRYCRILDQNGNIYDGCTRSFDVSWEAAQFRCRMLYWGDMDEIESLINVSLEKSMRDVTMSLSEDNSHFVLTCQYRSRVIPCRAASVASKRQMLLLDGHLGDHYSAYDTRVETGRCSLEIRKPLLQEDYGVWRIYLELSSSEYSGCVFNIPGPNTDDPSMEKVPEAKAKLIEVFHDQRTPTTTNTELRCEVPYPIDYCYLSGPEGGDYKPNEFDRLKTLGICRFVVQNVTTGKWACGVNDDHADEDHLSYFDVKVYDQPGRVITSNVRASAGDENKQLLCKTILNLPVELCRFVSPSGEVHGLSDSIAPSENSRFRYYGEGLRAGECGLEIVKLEKEDFGRWKCSIRVQGVDYAIGVDLIEEVMSKSALVAISVSVAVVACLIAAFFAYKKFYRRQVPYRNELHVSAL